MNRHALWGRHDQPFASRKQERATMQMPQGVDAKHGDELFPVQRQYIAINSAVRRASFGAPKISAFTLETARNF
jgi:hypothetical protein